MTNENIINKLYIGYFDRAYDPDGFNYWVSLANSGMSILDIANNFSLSAEYSLEYAGLDNYSLLNKIYNNLFNRDIDPEGLAYWSEHGKPVGRLIVDIISGAQGNDAVTLTNTAIVTKDWATTQPFVLEDAKNAVDSIGNVQGNGVTITFGNPVFASYQEIFTNAMTAAWKQWGNHGMLDVQLNFVDLGTNILAFATPRNEFFTGRVTIPGSPITQSNVGIEVNTGKDMNGDLPDITITVARNLSQFFQYDITSILAHEIGHGLGFRTELFDFDENYSTITSWDEYLTFPTGTQGIAHFNGPEAMEIYGGPVPITGYYNATHPIGTNSVMGPTFGIGEIRPVASLDLAMMVDIGIIGLLGDLNALS